MFDKNKTGARSCGRTEVSTRRIFPCKTQKRILFHESRMFPCSSSSIQVTLWFGLFWFLKATKKNSSVANPMTGVAVILKRLQEFRKQRMPFSGKLLHASTVPPTAAAAGLGLHKTSTYASGTLSIQLLPAASTHSKTEIIPHCWQTAAFTHYSVVHLAQPACKLLLFQMLFKKYALHWIKYVLYARFMKHII